MKQPIEANVTFKNNFDGELELKEGSVSIGMLPHQASPYKLLQAALISCLHSTFLDIIEKKRLTVESVSYHSSGFKRDEVPATIETLHLDVHVKGIQNKVAVEKSFDLATKVCSVYNTISQVGTITYTIHYID
jgi:putative redox protein